MILLGICRDPHPDPRFQLESALIALAVMEALDGLPPPRRQLPKKPDSPEAWRDVLQGAWRDDFIHIEDRKLRSFLRAAVALRKEDKDAGGQYV